MKTERVLFLALAFMGISCSFHAAAMEDVPFVRQEQTARGRERESFRNRIFQDTFRPMETEEKSGEVPPVSSVSFYVNWHEVRLGSIFFSERADRNGMLLPQKKLSYYKERQLV